MIENEDEKDMIGKRIVDVTIDGCDLVIHTSDKIYIHKVCCCSNLNSLTGEEIETYSFERKRDLLRKKYTDEIKKKYEPVTGVTHVEFLSEINKAYERVDKELSS